MNDPQDCTESALPSRKRRNSIPLPQSKCSRKRPATRDSKTTFPATIVDLADELLLLVINISFNCISSNWKDRRAKLSFLRNLSLVNRRFHRLVTEKLYQSFEYGTDPYLFLRTIIGSPDLAKCVHNVAFSVEDKVPGVRILGYQPNDQDKRSIYDGMRLTGLHDWEAWVQDCNHPEAYEDTLYSSILMHTKDVREISVKIGRVMITRERSITQWLDMFRRAKHSSPRDKMHTFNHLRCIRVTANQSISISELTPLFHLDSLTELEINDLREPSRSNLVLGPSSVLRRELPAGCNNIETFTFVDGFVHPDVLDVLLATCRSLNYLHIEFGGVELPLDKLLYTNTNLSTMLERHTASLKGLYVGTKHLRHVYNSWDCLYPNLEKMTSLKHLAAWGHTIFQGEEDFVLRPMPPALENLMVLCNYPEELDAHLEQLALHHSFWAPSLRRLNCIDGSNVYLTLNDIFSDSDIDISDQGWKIGNKKWWLPHRGWDSVRPMPMKEQRFQPIMPLTVGSP